MKVRLKKVLISLLAVMLLFTMVGCGNKAEEAESKENTQQEEIVQSDEETEKTDEEKNEELRKTAVEAIFTEINGGNWLGKKVYATGEISFFNEESSVITFTLTTKEGEGYGGYEILTSSVIDESFSELKEGDIVKIYGVVDEPNELGMPTIISRIIEKQSSNTTLISKDELKSEIEESLLQEYKGKSYSLDILTSSSSGKYIPSIQLDSPEFNEESNCVNAIQEILKGVIKSGSSEYIEYIDFSFVADYKLVFMYTQENVEALSDESDLSQIVLQKM